MAKLDKMEAKEIFQTIRKSNCAVFMLLKHEFGSEKRLKKLQIPVTTQQGLSQVSLTAARVDLKYKVQWRILSSIQNKNKLVSKET